ncbi:MAG: methyltransferase domain-containing protein [Planctomycetia bacterium]|nr:methyltransferase domain-containing protein [Planctomycetia bacterium]
MSRPARERSAQFDRRVDFGRTAEDYGRFRAGFPDELFARLRSLGVGHAGQRALDLGTGTGSLGRGLARQDCRVTALDLAAPLLHQARRLDVAASVAVDYVVGRAEFLPFANASLDVVTAGQCWHWFDRARAASEVRRVLVPGGRLVIAHFDWLPLAGNVVEATEQLIERFNPEWHFGGRNGRHPEWLPGLAEVGFEDPRTFSFDQAVPYSHEAWRGRIRASAGVAATLSEDEVARFDGELARILAERFPRDPIAVPHRVFAIVAASPHSAIEEKP